MYLCEDRLQILDRHLIRGFLKKLTLKMIYCLFNVNKMAWYGYLFMVINYVLLTTEARNGLVYLTGWAMFFSLKLIHQSCSSDRRSIMSHGFVQLSSDTVIARWKCILVTCYVPPHTFVLEGPSTLPGLRTSFVSSLRYCVFVMSFTAILIELVSQIIIAISCIE